jgi:hypothetical protein
MIKINLSFPPRHLQRKRRGEATTSALSKVMRDWTMSGARIRPMRHDFVPRRPTSSTM